MRVSIARNAAHREGQKRAEWFPGPASGRGAAIARPGRRDKGIPGSIHVRRMLPGVRWRREEAAARPR